jgi:site-specific recombinase XerD
MTPLPTIQHTIADFLQYLVVERCLSPATQQAYAGDLRLFFTWAITQGTGL